MKKINLVLCILCIVLISCKYDGTLKESEVIIAKEMVISKGDVSAYGDLLIYYQHKKDFESILPFSLVMAYKYNSSEAYFDIYQTTILMYNKGMFDYTLIKYLDPQSRKFALDNLIKSAEMGSSISKKYLAKYYIEGKYLPQNIPLGEKLQEEIKVRVGPDTNSNGEGLRENIKITE